MVLEAFMKTEAQGIRVPMQVGSELRIRNTGEIVVDNPETEMAEDALLSYRFDPQTGEHVLRLLGPVADHNHLKDHRTDD
jgi:hypothetical protein